MLVPIIMAVLTLTLKYPIIRWVNIIVAIKIHPAKRGKKIDKENNSLIPDAAN